MVLIYICMHIYIYIHMYTVFYVPVAQKAYPFRVPCNGLVLIELLKKVGF